MLHERSHLSVLVLGGAPAVRERESWLEFYEAASVKGEGGGWNRAGGGADMMSTTNVEYRITLHPKKLIAREICKVVILKHICRV